MKIAFAALGYVCLVIGCAAIGDGHWVAGGVYLMLSGAWAFGAHAWEHVR